MKRGYIYWFEHMEIFSPGCAWKERYSNVEMERLFKQTIFRGRSGAACDPEVKNIEEREGKSYTSRNY